MVNKHSYFYEAHCENGVASSKRLYGGLGFTVVQLCIIVATIISLVKTGELSSTVSSLIDFDLITSASLLGLSTITRAFGSGKTQIGNTTEQQTKETEE